MGPFSPRYWVWQNNVYPPCLQVEVRIRVTFIPWLDIVEWRRLIPTFEWRDDPGWLLSLLLSSPDWVWRNNDVIFRFSSRGVSWVDCCPLPSLPSSYGWSGRWVVNGLPSLPSQEVTRGDCNHLHSTQLLGWRLVEQDGATTFHSHLIPNRDRVQWNNSQ